MKINRYPKMGGGGKIIWGRIHTIQTQKAPEVPGEYTGRGKKFATKEECVSSCDGEKENIHTDKDVKKFFSGGYGIVGEHQTQKSKKTLSPILMTKERKHLL